jgi:hypothetical protein
VAALLHRRDKDICHRHRAASLLDVTTKVWRPEARYVVWTRVIA